MSERKWFYNGVEFEIGDRVMVDGIAETEQPDGMGDGIDWQNSWVEDMNDAIFKEFEIYDIDEAGVRFVEIEGDWNTEYMFPLSALRKVTLQ